MHTDTIDMPIECANCNHPYCNKSKITQYVPVQRRETTRAEITYECHNCNYIRTTIYKAPMNLLIILGNHPLFGRKCINNTPA